VLSVSLWFYPLNSMKQRVLVTGARGFVGRNICRALVDADYAVVGLSRSLPPDDETLAGVEYVQGDVKDTDTIPTDLLEGISAIVHCVGIIAERRGKGQTFEAVHVGGTRNLLAAAKGKEFTGRFVYLSAAGASPNAKAKYSRTKAEAERLTQESGFPFTIFRPSVILGSGCEFVEMMKGLIRKPPLAPFPLPFVPVPGNGKNLFQPVYIGDLTEAITQSLKESDNREGIIEVGGTDRVTFDELLTAFQEHLGTKKPLLHLPMPLMFAAASVLESVLPAPPITVDQLYNLQIDNVCDNTALNEAFGITPLGFAEALARTFAPENKPETN
jgi:nucleoside-diphosphate-sugar epimerase